MSGLRERNRRAAMEHIQDTAFALFEERGYAHVTIAEIAAAADVGTTTFYRLFQTKEGLFTAAPWDSAIDPDAIDLDDLHSEVRRLVSGNEWRGMRWVIEEPEVRHAILASLDVMATQLIEAMVDKGQDRMDAAVHVRDLLFGTYFTSLELWHLEGRQHSFESYYDRACTKKDT